MIVTSSPDARPLPGGPISTDLLNTRWGPLDGGVDWLDRDEAVQLFASSHGVEVSLAKIATARGSLIEARTLIEALFLASPAAVDAETIDAINSALNQATVRLDVADEGPNVAITSDDGVKRIVIESILDAVDHVRERPARIRSCEHEDCTLWFVDTSKAGRRRWCSMDTCGNRTKARRHYARTASEERS